MMVPGWYLGTGGMPLLSLANTSMLVCVLAATGLLTLALFAVLFTQAGPGRRVTHRPERPRRPGLSDRHAWAGAER